MFKVSIIMAVYNCESTIKDAIDSIINQTYQDWELIICDDCSTDNTLAIIIEYEKQFTDKIKVIRNNVNSKLAKSLNHCLEYAQGEFIARMDGDDISLPNRLEKQINFLECNKEYDVVGTAMTPFDEQGSRTPIVLKEIPNKYDLINNPCFHHATIVMKKSVYNALNGYTVLPRTTRGQDYDLWFRFFSCGYQGYNLKDSLYKVRESLHDLKRRTLMSRVQISKTKFYGYRLLKYPYRYYIYILSPILGWLVPAKVRILIRNSN